MEYNNNLDQPAAVSLVGTQSLTEIAHAEGFDSTSYAVALARRIQNPDVKLSTHRERIQALASMGSRADEWTAQVLAEHFQVLESLFMRFALEAEAVLRASAGSPKGAEIAERYLNASTRAQRAALSVLSALKAQRDAPSPNAMALPPTTSAAATAAGGSGDVLEVATPQKRTSA